LDVKGLPRRNALAKEAFEEVHRDLLPELLSISETCVQTPPSDLFPPMVAARSSTTARSTWRPARDLPLPLVRRWNARKVVAESPFASTRVYDRPVLPSGVYDSKVLAYQEEMASLLFYLHLLLFPSQETAN